jgi:uncharacterized membrane protein
MAFCSGCGTAMDDTANFCPRCGRSRGGAGEPWLAARSSVISDKAAGALAYFLFPAIVFLIIEPYRNNRFVRFHCFQSIAFAIVSMIPRLALYLPVAGIFLWPVLELALFVVWIVLVVKALQGEKFKLPLVGEWAEDQAVRAS